MLERREAVVRENAGLVLEQDVVGLQIMMTAYGLLPVAMQAADGGG